MERQLLSKVSLNMVPFVLLSAFYAFNMHYTSGCTNNFSFIEPIFLDANLPKRSKLHHFITSLMNIDV